MPDIRQLSKVLEIREKAEATAAAQLAKAQQSLVHQQSQLQTMLDYRQEYLMRISDQNNQTISAQYFQSLQELVSRLDGAMGRSREAVDIAGKVVEQRQGLWQKARAERRAVELLIEKEQSRQALKQARKEQQTMDEFAMNKFIRSERVIS